MIYLRKDILNNYTLWLNVYSISKIHIKYLVVGERSGRFIKI